MGREAERERRRKRKDYIPYNTNMTIYETIRRFLEQLITDESLISEALCASRYRLHDSKKREMCAYQCVV